MPAEKFSRTWRLKTGGSDESTVCGSHGSLDLLSGGLIEAMWETLIALAMAAAISISVISLSAHLNEAKKLRQAGAGTMQSTAEHRLPSVADIGPAQPATQFQLTERHPILRLSTSTELGITMKNTAPEAEKHSTSISRTFCILRRLSNTRATSLMIPT